VLDKIFSIGIILRATYSFNLGDNFSLSIVLSANNTLPKAPDPSALKRLKLFLTSV
jgi:hypothetical protein